MKDQELREAKRREQEIDYIRNRIREIRNDPLDLNNRHDRIHVLNKRLSELVRPQRNA